MYSIESSGRFKKDNVKPEEQKKTEMKDNENSYFDTIMSGLNESLEYSKGNLRNTIKESISETIQGLTDLGIKTSFTEKELNELGIVLQEPEITTEP